MTWTSVSPNHHRRHALRHLARRRPCHRARRRYPWRHRHLHATLVQLHSCLLPSVRHHRLCPRCIHLPRRDVWIHRHPCRAYDGRLRPTAQARRRLCRRRVPAPKMVTRSNYALSLGKSAQTAASGSRSRSMASLRAILSSLSSVSSGTVSSHHRIMQPRARPHSSATLTRIRSPA